MAKLPNWRSYGKIIVFIDAANVIYSMRSLGWKLAYKKLHKYFGKNSNLMGIYFYSAYSKTSVAQQGLFEMLSRIGFIMRTKELKYIKSRNKIVMVKGNVDVEMTVDMIDLLRKYDTAVLLSGDSDFAPLVNYVKGKKKKVVVISTRGHISKELRDVADKLLYLNSFRRYWELKS